MWNISYVDIFFHSVRPYVTLTAEPAFVSLVDYVLPRNPPFIFNI